MELSAESRSAPSAEAAGDLCEISAGVTICVRADGITLRQRDSW